MRKQNIIVIAIIALVAIVAIFSVQKTEAPICGDGICSQEELESCQSDCIQSCVATGGDIGQTEQKCSIGWKESYTKLEKEGFIQNSWLRETEEIDISNPKIKELAKELRKDTPKETAKAIAKWTYNNIRYASSEGYFDCYSIKASEVIERGTGICSTMSKVNIALLRANGIPAYSITGCFKFNEACKLKQTFFGRLPKFSPIEVEPSGYAPTKGYLHNWVVIPLFDGQKIESVIIESTSGVLFEDSCINYREYYVAPPDSLTCGLPSFDSNVNDCEEWQ